MMKKLIVPALSALMLFSAVTPVYAVGDWTEVQFKVNQIASIAREIGLAESSPIITEASRIWWLEENEKQNAAAEEQEFLQSYHTEAVMLAKTMYCEARGISSKKELSMICWTVLNRYDHGFAESIPAVITTPRQFAYRSSAPTVNDCGIDLLALAEDVLLRWHRENMGQTDVGRTLPKEYLYYHGNGEHNFFKVGEHTKGYYDFGVDPY